MVYISTREFDRSPSPNSFSLLAQRASPHRSPNRPAKCVQLAGLKSIVLAQAKQAKDSIVSDRPEVIDWQNNFNLALYYLAAGQFEESDGLYDSRSGRFCQRASEASRDAIVSDRSKVIEMAIRDLDD